MAKRKDRAAFAEVRVVEDAQGLEGEPEAAIVDATDSGIEIVVSGGIVILLQRGFDAGTLRKALVCTGGAWMLNLPSCVRVFFCLVPADMRRSFDGLSMMVENIIQRDVFSGHLYVFINKRHELNVFEYLRDIFDRFQDTPISQIDNFLPDRWKILRQTKTSGSTDS